MNIPKPSRSDGFYTVEEFQMVVGEFLHELPSIRDMSELDQCSEGLLGMDILTHSDAEDKVIYDLNERAFSALTSHRLKVIDHILYGIPIRQG